MPWVRFDDGFDDSDDIDNMSTDAIALHVCATTWSSRNLTDGFIPEGRVRKLPGGNDQAIAELCAGEKPWWVRVSGGFQVRSYLKYNPSGQEFKERREEISQARSEAGKKGMETRWGKAKEQQTDSNDDNKRDNKTGDLLLTNDNKIITPNPESRIPLPETPKPNKSLVADATAQRWDEFCSIYPKRNGALNKAKAQEKFKHLARDHPAILQGVRNYRGWADATGKTGTQFIKQMDSWLNGRLWLEDYQIPNGMVGERDRILEALNG